MAQRPSKWCKKYGASVPVPVRVPQRLWEITKAAGERKGISGTEAIIEALLNTYTNEDLTGEPNHE